MKSLKISFIALGIVILAAACSKENDSTTNSSSLNGTPWSFEIELAGQTHRAQGVYPENNFIGGLPSNFCYGVQTQGNYGVSFKLSDKTASYYVSGEPLELTLAIAAGELGNNNEGAIDFDPMGFSAYMYMRNFAEQNGFDWYNDFVADSARSWSNGYQLSNDIFNIKLTELGSPPTSTGGTTLPTYSQIKGEYQGTLYFSGDSSSFSDDKFYYYIPVPISIKFTAVRIQ